MRVNPLSNCQLQGRAFVLALKFPKRLAAEVRDVGLLSFSLAIVTRNVSDQFVGVRPMSRKSPENRGSERRLAKAGSTLR